MSIQAIVFDLDGTLLDTLEDLTDAMNRVLDERGFPVHPPRAYRSFVGEGTRLLVKRALPEGKRSSDMIRSCLEAFFEEYDRNWNKKTKPYRGVPEMLDKITFIGIKKAILSNKSDAFTKRCVTHLLRKWDFDVLFGQRDGVPRKPDPIGAMEISEHLNIPPSEFLFVGDSGTDMKTASAAGMFPVGVLWGFRTADELSSHGAQTLIKHPSEILNLLTGAHPLMI